MVMVLMIVDECGLFWNRFAIATINIVTHLRRNSHPSVLFLIFYEVSSRSACWCEFGRESPTLLQSTVLQPTVLVITFSPHATLKCPRNKTAFFCASFSKTTKRKVFLNFWGLAIAQDISTTAGGSNVIEQILLGVLMVNYCIPLSFLLTYLVANHGRDFTNDYVATQMKL